MWWWWWCSFIVARRSECVQKKNFTRRCFCWLRNETETAWWTEYRKVVFLSFFHRFHFVSFFSSNILYIASSSRFLYSSFSIQIRLRILTVISNEVSAVGVQPSCQRNLRVACEAPGGLGHRAAGRLLASGAVAVQSEHDRLAGDTAVEGESLASQKCS